MYNAQADTININDIATTDNNKFILNNISRRNVNIIKGATENSEQLWIRDEVEDHTDYRPEGISDMGWLGYFVGKNEHIKKLFIRDFEVPYGVSLLEILEAFLRGVNNNKSITTLDFRMDLLGGRVFTMLGPFFENSATLAHLQIDQCTLGDDGWRLLALAIGSSKHKSFQAVSLTDCNISDEALVDIITSLSMHPRLQTLELEENRLSTKGCMALATLLRCSATELQYLDLSSNELDDEGIDALVPELMNCSHLNTLVISNNVDISLKGWWCLATILEAPNCSSLATLYVSRNNIDDEVVNAFTSAPLSNHTLTTLGLNVNSVTNEGWKAFSKLLCDTSTVNSTYLSNHTINYLGTTSDQNQLNQKQLRPLLDINKIEDKIEVAMIKILQTHNDINMTQFFEWEFKVLPLMIGWLEMASDSEITMPENFEPNIGPRKLSSIYQFVRGMPVLYVETYLRKELEDIKAAELQTEETIEEEKRKLVLLQERKTSIMKRLGQPSTK